MSREPLTARLLAMAASQAADAEVAYLCAWAAVTRQVRAISRAAGVRAQFSLRQNGTLRTRKEGAYRLPELTPAREDHQWRAALASLAPVTAQRLLGHPNVIALARRVPTLNGKPLLQDRYGQRPLGILDVALTRDPRYPVWHTIDLGALEHGLSHGAAPEAAAELLRQLATLLRTLAGNLLAPDEDADADLARLGLPLVLALAAALEEGADDEGAAR